MALKAASAAVPLPAQDRLQLLGEVVFVGADRVVPLRAERRFQLLVVLALRRAPVERDWLAALFWPERDNATARRNLRKLAFDAQEIEWVRGIESERATLAWRVDTDAAAFRGALDEGRVADALRLYRGPLGAGLDASDNNTFNAWLHAERAALNERWRAAVLTCLSHPATDPAGALDLAQRLLAADSLDEEAVVAVVHAHQRLGQGGAALRVYDAYKTRLAETLGIEPAARVRSLARAGESNVSVLRVAPAAVAADSMIGRAEELRELLALLERDECRILTLSGPGGIGKSRLAKAAVARLEHAFPQGLWWVPLDDLESVDQVAPRVAQLLGLELAANQNATQRVGTFLAAHRALVVLDNAEQIARLSLFVDRLVTMAPQLKLLVTSRRRIAAAGEWLLPLAGLPVPPLTARDVDARACDAVRLFEVRAFAAKADFDPVASGAAIVDVVRALGGLPLAIELAANWVRLLPLEEMRSEIGRSLDLLERAEEGDERAEHRSVRATFESSWRLLAPQEQASLAALAVFSGPFTRAAARAVAGATLPLLGSLADKSLLQTNDGARFSLHPLIQQFGREKLSATAGVADRVRQQHAEYFCNLVRAYESWHATDQKVAMATLAVEQTDLLAAYRWALAQRRADLLQPVAAAFRYFYELTGRLDEGLLLLAEVERVCVSGSRLEQRARAEAAQARAALHYRAGQFEICAREAKLALKLCRTARDSKGMRSAMTIVASALGKLGRYTESRRYSEECLRLAEAAHDHEVIATCLNNLGLVESQRGFPESAVPFLERTLGMTRAAGDRTGSIAALNNLSVALINAGQPARALPHLQEGLALVDDAGFVVQRSYFLANFAQATFELGELAAARRWAEDGLVSMGAGSDRSSEPSCRIVLGRVALAQGSRQEAQRQLRQAAQAAVSMRLQRFTVRAALAYAEFLLADMALAEGVGLLTCVKASGAANRIDLARAQCLLDQARTGLDEATFNEAMKAGEERGFDVALERITATS